MRRLGAVLVAVLVLGGCRSREGVVVGSKNFTEQRILGELLAQTVESVGLRADRRLDLGGTFVCDATFRTTRPRRTASASAARSRLSVSCTDRSPRLVPVWPPRMRPEVSIHDTRSSIAAVSPSERPTGCPPPPTTSCAASAGPSAAATGRMERVGPSTEMNVPSGTGAEVRNETQ